MLGYDFAIKVSCIFYAKKNALELVKHPIFQKEIDSRTVLKSVFQGS